MAAASTTIPRGRQEAIVGWAVVGRVRYQVFVADPDQPIVQGIPVPEGTRFVLTNAEWTPR
jgi:hypothetical protein